MHDPTTGRTHPMRHHHTQTAIALAGVAVLTLGAASCGKDEPVEPTSSSSSSTSQVTYDDTYAYTEAKKVSVERQSHNVQQKLPEDTEWATASYIKTYNDEVDALKEKGITRKGTVKVDSVHEGTSNPDAVGGWDLTMYQCSTSTVRLYKGGKDITARPEDPTKPMPKGPQKNVHLVSYTTPDDGKTWQVNKSQILFGKDAKESPCAK